MPALRPVVNSAGEEFPSITEAALTEFIKPSSIHIAAQATSHGVGRTAAGKQWAFADEVPEVWPDVPDRGYHQSKPVVNSNGEEFSSMSEAARNTSATVGAISQAVIATRHGKKRMAGELQWALVNEVPKVWPIEVPTEKYATARASAPVSDPVYPPELTEKQWLPIPGFPDYEVSSTREVRDIGDMGLWTIKSYQGVSLVCIQNRLYNVVSLMMLAFVGPKPHGHTIQKRDGTCERLSNLFYGPRKPRKWGMTHQEIMDELKGQKRHQERMDRTLDYDQEMEKRCLEAHDEGRSRPLREVIDELRAEQEERME